MMQTREGERRQEKGDSDSRRREGRRRDNGAGSMTAKETEEGVWGAD